MPDTSTVSISKNWPRAHSRSAISACEGTFEAHHDGEQPNRLVAAVAPGVIGPPLHNAVACVQELLVVVELQHDVTIQDEHVVDGAGPVEPVLADLTMIFLGCPRDSGR
jgi:hypothetical protein